MRLDVDRFDNYRDIIARFDSTATCGHSVTEGQSIGWNPRNKKTQCSECWFAWCYENRAADSYEQFGTDVMFDH